MGLTQLTVRCRKPHRHLRYWNVQSFGSPHMDLAGRCVFGRREDRNRQQDAAFMVARRSGVLGNDVRERILTPGLAHKMPPALADPPA